MPALALGVKKRLAARAPVVAVLVAVALAGCAESYGMDRAGRGTLAEGQYDEISFTVSAVFDLHVAVEVHSGPSIDVFVMDDYNHGQFRAGTIFAHREACGGVVEQNLTRDCTLRAGRYHVVFDNSIAGAASPPEDDVDDTADVSWVVRGN